MKIIVMYNQSWGVVCEHVLTVCQWLWFGKNYNGQPYLNSLFSFLVSVPVMIMKFITKL
jgi:hypothetical protein